MILDAGMKGFSMFELGKVGIFIALAGIIYLFLFLRNCYQLTARKRRMKKIAIPPYTL